jgi:hypothetical protein
MSLIYSPGPAAYDIGTTLGNAPQYSIRGRHKNDINFTSPGPGQYQPENHQVGKGIVTITYGILHNKIEIR